MILRRNSSADAVGAAASAKRIGPRGWRRVDGIEVESAFDPVSVCDHRRPLQATSCRCEHSAYSTSDSQHSKLRRAPPHPPLSWGFLATPTQETTALRDFNPAYDRSGSIVCITAPQHCCLLHLD